MAYVGFSENMWFILKDLIIFLLPQESKFPFLSVIITLHDRRRQKDANHTSQDYLKLLSRINLRWTEKDWDYLQV